MSKIAPVINRAETGAAIDRAMETLRAIKGQLRAKKLNGTALHQLMEVARDELSAAAGQFRAQYDLEIDALITSLRAREDEL